MMGIIPYKTLNEALSHFYNVHVVGKRIPAQAGQPLKDYIAMGDANKQEAQKRLEELKALDVSTGGRLKERCFISSIHKIALEEALNAPALQVPQVQP